MDGPALSPRERQILEAIETGLRGEDSGLDRRLSTMRLNPLRRVLGACAVAICRVPTAGVVLLIACTLGLLAVGAQVGSVPVLGAFAVVWTITLIVLAGRVAKMINDPKRRG